MEEDRSPQFTDEKPSLVAENEISYIKLSIFLLIIITLMVLPLFFSNKSGSLITDVTTQATSTRSLSDIAVNKKNIAENFRNIEVEAKAAFVWDINVQKILFAKNDEAQLPLASLTKLMTAYVASQYIADDNIIIVNKNSLEEEGDSGLFANESWRFRDLRDFTLMVSSNDGADTIAMAAGRFLRKNRQTSDEEARSAFISAMNEAGESFGLTQTYFLNETGLDPSEVVSGGYGSARDMALLIENILATSSDILENTTKNIVQFESLDNFIHIATNTNELINEIPGLLGSKTGFTDLAGGNLVVVFSAGLNKPIAIVVLGSSKEGRFSDMKKLIEAMFE